MEVSFPGSIQQSGKFMEITKGGGYDKHPPDVPGSGGSKTR